MYSRAVKGYSPEVRLLPFKSQLYLLCNLGKLFNLHIFRCEVGITMALNKIAMRIKLDNRCKALSTMIGTQ